MAFGIPFAFVIDSLFNEADVSLPHGCRSTASAGGRGACGTSRRHPYGHPQARCSPQRAEPRHDELLRALDDSYVLFVDVPGFSKEQVSVKVDDGYLVVSTADKSPAQEAGPVKAVLMERRRGGVHQRWKLPEDALLDGIHAKLQNGELVVVIPKRTEKVSKHFVIPVLGHDKPPTQLDASAPAQGPEAPAEHPMVAEPEPAAQAEPAADAPMTAEVENAAHAEPAAGALAAADALAAPTNAASPATADAATVPAPVQAAAPLATIVAASDAAMPDVKEDDGSWTDVSDEEREAMQAFVRAKGKAPMEGPVLEEIERQEAQRIAQMQHDSDVD